jgi:alanyl-tRNA synthetase
MVTANKEYDPAMHTAEHILNRTMDKMFSCGRAFSAHIERKKSKCDYKFGRALDDTEISSVEEQVNRVIKQNLSVSESYYSRIEAEIIFNLSKLPENAGDTVRVISVGDYDDCPCSGVHVKNTSDIGEFRIVSSDYNNGVLRLRFKVIRPDDQ